MKSSCSIWNTLSSTELFVLQVFVKCIYLKANYFWRKVMMMRHLFASKLHLRFEKFSGFNLKRRMSSERADSHSIVSLIGSCYIEVLVVTLNKVGVIIVFISIPIPAPSTRLQQVNHKRDDTA